MVIYSRTKYIAYWVALLLIATPVLAERIEVDIPPGCSALNGTWTINGGEMVDLDITDCTKNIEVNYDTQKFIIWGGQEEIYGDLNLDFIQDALPFEVDIDITYAHSDAYELTAPSYNIRKEIR